MPCECDSGVTRRWPVFATEELPNGGNGFEFIRGAVWELAMAEESQCAASSMPSACVTVGVGNAWWLNLKVSVVRSPPVSAMIILIHR